MLFLKLSTDVMTNDVEPVCVDRDINYDICEKDILMIRKDLIKWDTALI